MCRTYLFSLRPGPARWRLGDTFLSIDKDDWGAETQQVSDGFTARFTKGPRCRVQDVERYLFLLIEPYRSPNCAGDRPKADDSYGSYPCLKWDMLPHKLVQNVVQFVLQLLFHFPRWKNAKKRGKCSTFRWSLNVRQQAYPKAWVLSSVFSCGCNHR